MEAVRDQVVSTKPTIKIDQKAPRKSNKKTVGTAVPSPPVADDERITGLVQELYVKQSELTRLGESQRQALTEAKERVNKLRPSVFSYLQDRKVSSSTPVAATGGGKEEGAEGLAVSWGYACKKPRISLTKLREILRGALTGHRKRLAWNQFSRPGGIKETGL